MKLHAPDARLLSSKTGSAMVIVLGVVTILSFVLVTVLRRTASAQARISHVAAWQESITAAEAGADYAVAALRSSLTDSSNAFAGWSITDGQGLLLPNQGRRYVLSTLVRKGEGDTRLDAEVVMDRPAELLDGDMQWYRIRSMGTTYLPGVTYSSSDRRDHALRRLSFFWNPRKARAVNRPQATRLVELLVRPVGFENAIVSDLPLNLNNYQIIVDSYDSRDNTKSTNALYDPAKRQENGDVATNSQLIDAGSAQIFGDAFTNSGSVTNAANITGEQRSDFYQELLPIQKPTWFTIDVFPILVTQDTTLIGGTKANPRRYKFTKIDLSGDNVLTIAPAVAGMESYVEIWVTGDMKASGNGTITLKPNTNVKIFLEGNLDIKGNGTFNANSQPSRLQILGVKGASGSSQSMSFGGNGLFVGAVYAPNHDVQFGSNGTGGTFWGSLIGRSVSIAGASTFHYDEALVDNGYITDYKIQSWFEDNSPSKLVLDTIIPVN